MPIRIQRQWKKGWRKPKGSVIVDRSSRWGNPYKWDVYGRDLSIKLFRELIEAMDLRLPIYLGKLYATSAQIRQELGGKDVCCTCHLDQNCHGDILLEIANP